MNLSYHAWKDYNECPKRYFLKYRRRAPATVPRNDYFMLYGKTTERFFTHFCNLWRYKLPYMPPKEIRIKLKKVYDGILNSSVVNWDVIYAKMNSDQIFEQSFTDICAVMDSHNQNYFLNTKSEISIGIETRQGVNVTGRLDFIHTDPGDKEDIIFDGKGTKKLGNVSEDQLLFYALLYYFHFKRPPKGLGFFYYQYNLFKEVEFSLARLNDIRGRISESVKSILKDSEFKACPSARTCKYCDYRNGCEPHIKDALTRKRGSKIDIPYEGGVQEIGL